MFTSSLLLYSSLVEWQQLWPWPQMFVTNVVCLSNTKDSLAKSILFTNIFGKDLQTLESRVWLEVTWSISNSTKRTFGARGHSQRSDTINNSTFLATVHWTVSSSSTTIRDCQSHDNEVENEEDAPDYGDEEADPTNIGDEDKPIQFLKQILEPISQSYLQFARPSLRLSESLLTWLWGTGLEVLVTFEEADLKFFGNNRTDIVRRTRRWIKWPKTTIL